MLPSHVGDRFLRRSQVGLGHDLEQRRAGAVQVDAGVTVEVLVHGLASVLLEVRAGDADALLVALVVSNEEFAVLDDRQLVLADLVALRQIRVEIVLAGENRSRCHRRVDGEPELAGHAHDFLVEHRQHARIAEVDQAGLGVRLRAVGRRGAGEDLAPRRELRVDLQPDDDFPGGTHA
jgi:hypothetical protein